MSNLPIFKIKNSFDFGIYKNIKYKKVARHDYYYYKYVYDYFILPKETQAAMSKYIK